MNKSSVHGSNPTNSSGSAGSYLVGVCVTFDPDNTRLTDTRSLGRFSHEHEGCCAGRQVEYTTAYTAQVVIIVVLIHLTWSSVDGS